MSHQPQTIAALATPQGRGGISIIRLSGQAVLEIGKEILKKEPSPRHAHFSKFYDEKEQVIDEGVVLFFPAPHSFTGEDVLELHGHASPITQDLILKRIFQLGARPARPGEFSERAFLNGKMDLAQAEAIADLIDAASEEAARSALRSLQGEFSKHIHQLLSELIDLRIYVEAAIDFPEEEIDFLSEGNIGEKLKDIFSRIEKVEQSAKQGALLREGISIAIIGKPNAGKSSLLNNLTGKETAIVTNIPGTTRDVLRENILIDELPLHIVDTAGLRQTEDIVEKEGIRRAFSEIEKADCVLCVMDATLEEKEFTLFEEAEEKLAHKKKIIVRTKIDLIEEPASSVKEAGDQIVSLSTKTGAGIELLKKAIKEIIGFEQVGTENNFIARRRHLEAITLTKRHLQIGQEKLLHRAGELVAEELRLAQQALGEITGQFRSDELLGRIFSSFCIGK